MSNQGIFPIYHIMVMHDWAYIWLKSDAMWERKYGLNKGLHKARQSIKTENHLSPNPWNQLLLLNFQKAALGGKQSFSSCMLAQGLVLLAVYLFCIPTLFLDKNPLYLCLLETCLQFFEHNVKGQMLFLSHHNSTCQCKGN